MADLKNVDAALAHRILDEVVELPEDGPDGGLDAVVGHAGAKQALREAVLLPALRPDLFTGLRAAAGPRGLLLFGPPGNGKTLLARALCRAGGLVFFALSAASLTSKWLGESEKLVRALFAVAGALAPAVVFLDEVDSVLSRRRADEHEAARRLKTQFLLELDGVRSANAGGCVLVMGATNRPWELDEAVLRRFGTRVHIGMPGAAARAQLLQALLARQEGGGAGTQLGAAQLAAVADATEGYSASDLTNLARDAAMAPLRQLDTAQLVKLPAARVRSICERDLRDAMQRVRPSVPRETLTQFAEWNQQYGDVSTD